MIFLMRLVVSGQSMEPTFRSGQTLFVSSLPYLFRKPRIGDAVVIKDPRDGRLLLKRIKKKDGNKFLVVGDNPSHSTDSKTFGAVHAAEILGTVVDK